MSQRVGGPFRLSRNGVQLKAAGDATYNLGFPKREMVMGPNGANGYKDVPQVAFIEVEITDDGSLDFKDLCTAGADTITLELANGKTVVLPDAVFAGEGTGSTADGKLTARWESQKQGEEIL